MNICDKLQVDIRQESISLSPNRILLKNMRWYIAALVVTLVVLPAFWQPLQVAGRILGIGIALYLAYYVLTDLILRVPLRYTFDKPSNAIYRESPLLGRKQIMTMDEAVIITSSDSGDWHYSLGIKKKQFLKNYQISPNFGSSRASEQLASAYETEILAAIVALIER